MFIKKLRLVNFCQYSDRTFEYGSGVTTVCGPNGSGKSNQIKAWYFLITNDFTVSDGTKEENIAWACDDKEASYLEGDFSHAHVDVNVRRYLKRGKTRATFSHLSEPVTGDDNVTKALLDLLGTDKHTLRHVCFVQQGDIDKIVAQKFSERAETLHRLFGLEKAEQLHKVLGERLKNVQVPTDLEAQTLEIELSTLLQQQKDRQAQLTSLNKRGDWATYDPAKDPDKLVHAAWLARAQADEEVRITEKNVAISSENRRLQQLVVDECQASLSQLLKTKEEFSTLADDARASLANLARLRQEAQRRQGLVLRLQNVDAELAKLPIPTGDSSEWTAQAARARAEAEEIAKASEADRQLLLSMRDVNDKTCRVCKSDITHLFDRKAQLQLAVNDADSKIFNLRQAEQTLLAEARDIDSRRTAHALKTRERNSLAETLSATPEVEIDEAVEAESRELVAAFDAASKAGTDKGHLLRSYQSDLTMRLSDEKADQAAHARALAVRDRLPAIHKTQAELDAGLEAAKIREATYMEWRLAVAAAKQADDAVTRAKAANDAAAAKATKRAAVLRWSNKLSSVRDRFHKEALPKIAAAEFLRYTEAPINALLQDFGIGFLVEVDAQKLSYIAVFADGRRVPAARLSGGLKVVLSLAFRLGLHELFASDIGFLALDEPTEFLDTSNVSCLRDALSRLSKISTAQHVQVILVTHEESFRGAFDGTIEVA